ncbi:MAG TPA: phosphotransferase [Acidimicrobiales bacterium]|nr:phosphotransferase [Acidimicrobiales bacterium]
MGQDRLDMASAGGPANAMDLTNPTPGEVQPWQPPAALVEAIGGYLARQRWYAGEGAPTGLQVKASEQLAELPSARGRLLWMIVEADGDSYQLVIGERPPVEAAERFRGHEEALVGAVGDAVYYDAVVDSEMALALLALSSGGAERAQRSRPMGAEQSNSSLVYDDRLILKIFRRLSLGGPNPDVEVTTALARAGFAHVAAPMVRWQRDGVDLAFGQQFLTGGSDGWALALTSIRDLYGTSATDEPCNPAVSGGDFAAEATRLGQVTAQMHLAMAETYGRSGELAERWQEMVRSLTDQVRREVPDLAEPGEGLLDRLRAVADPGPSVRVHGDYHLGQVMRSDAGWFVLDFEGEPNRPVEQRLVATSVMKDVAGMLRSLDYAPNFVLRERGGAEAPQLAELARAWGARNRRAFLAGYYEAKGVEELLPPIEDREAVRAAFELEKALYEVGYERAYRPDWIAIPMAALENLLRSSVPEVVKPFEAEHDDELDGTVDAEQTLY